MTPRISLWDFWGFFVPFKERLEYQLLCSLLWPNIWQEAPSGRVYFDVQFENMVHPGEDMAVGVWGCWSHCIHRQERDMDKWDQTGYEVSGPTTGDLSFWERPHPLKSSQPSKPALPFEKQMLKHLTPERTFHSLNIFSSYLHEDIFETIYMQQCKIRWISHNTFNGQK